MILQRSINTISQLMNDGFFVRRYAKDSFLPNSIFVSKFKFSNFKDTQSSFKELIDSESLDNRNSPSILMKNYNIAQCEERTKILEDFLLQSTELMYKIKNSARVAEDKDLVQQLEDIEFYIEGLIRRKCKHNKQRIKLIEEQSKK
jgi:hypothetical protein